MTDNAELRMQMECIYENTYTSVLKYVVAHARHREDIPDIVQNVYTDVFKFINRGGKIEDSERYVITAARHELHRQYGIFTRQRDFMSELSPEDDEPCGVPAADADCGSAVENKLVCEEIWRQISELDELTYRVFTLYFRCDSSLGEIAELLGVSEQTVKNRLYRTIARLRRLWAEESI